MAYDPDTPEWTEDEIARGRPGAQVLPADFVQALKRGRGRPAGSDKARITLRVDQDIVDHFKSNGRGWQTRMNEALRKAIG